MVYQVLVRADAHAEWEPFQSMTRDPLHALAIVRRASKIFGDVSVIQAESAHLLREQTLRLRAGEPSGQEASTLPSLTATPRISLVTGASEYQRWALEQGPGGDHDVPYRFEQFVPAHILRRWSQLMAQARPSDDIASYGVTALPQSDDASDANSASEPIVAPSMTRSERIV
jgi:hypothetical protein